MPKTIFINIDNYQFQILLSQFNQNILIRRDGFSVFISEKDEIEDEIFAKMFLKHSEINECSVCMEKNVVITQCGHNLCRICFDKIKKIDTCTTCPICRSCLNCQGH